MTACGGGGAGSSAGRDGQLGTTSTTQAAAPNDGCPPTPTPVTPDGPSAQAISLGRVDGHQIDAAVYPRPAGVGSGGGSSPWSQWGQGLVLSDGRFLSAAGDHRGPDGNSYLFVYDPQQRRIVRFTDVLSHVPHDRGEWGYGKVHAQIVAGPCRQAFVATYWGTDASLRYGGTYRGDLLFRLDPDTLTLESLGVPVPEHGIPSLAGSVSEGLLYGEAPTPTVTDATGSNQGAFFAYDTTSQQVVFRSDDSRHVGFRNVLVTADGTAYIAGNGNRLLVYQRGSTALREHPQRLPGTLRASTTPGPDGTVYGATQNPDRLFAFHGDGSIQDLGSARGYTTSLALAPDGRHLFYVPGAGGDSATSGTPLISVDTRTGEQTTVAMLNQLAEEKLGLTLAGSYSVAVDPSGQLVYVGLNAGPERDDPWGEVVLFVIDLT